MKKQMLATAIAILGIGSLGMQPAIGSKEYMSFAEIDEQVVTDIYNYKNPRLIIIEEQLELKTKENILIEKEEAEKKQIEFEKAEQERINNVWFNSYDIGDPSGINYDEMANVLAHSHYSNFLDISDAFVDAERAYGVNAFALVAIPGLESGWNTSERAKNGNNNIVGMNVVHNASRGYVYNSKRECIMDLARQLKAYYLTPGAQYFNGTSTSQVNKSYSESKDWYKNVDSIGDELVARYNELYK